MLDINLVELQTASAELFDHLCPVGTRVGITAQGWCWTVTAPCHAVSCSLSSEHGVKAARGLDVAKPPPDLSSKRSLLTKSCSAAQQLHPWLSHLQPDARGSSGGGFLIIQGTLLQRGAWCRLCSQQPPPESGVPAL